VVVDVGSRRDGRGVLHFSADEKARTDLL